MLLDTLGKWSESYVYTIELIKIMMLQDIKNSIGYKTKKKKKTNC